MNFIKITGARQHNLKNLSLEIPREKLVVITGLSGSGKSSLAFDTIYAEGQRRYVESLSAYARQFLELMEKPDVDHIEGLSPAISIEQRTASRNPRSTVATVTEIYDYFRLLYARIGERHCPQCGKKIETWSAQGMVADILARFSGKSIRLFSPMISGRQGSYEELFLRLKKNGFVKARADGKIFELEKIPSLSRYKKHTIELLVDEILISPAEKERLVDSVETAILQSKGFALAEGKSGSFLYSEKNACPDCGVGFGDMEPRLFSFNSPYGACPECGGLGVKTEISQDLIIPNPLLSIEKGAIAPWSKPVVSKSNRWQNSWSSYYAEILQDVCKRNDIPTDKPWAQLSKEHKKLFLYGGSFYKVHWSKYDKQFEGVIGNLNRRHAESQSQYVKEEIYNRYMREEICPKCNGARLKPEALSVYINKKNISQVAEMSVSTAKEFFGSLNLSERETLISKQTLKEINARLGFLSSVGLGYLTLNRRSETLSGGEAQRIHLATQIGSGLTGVLYVLDEPTIGLHPKDNTRLLSTLKSLRDMGNTLIVVEHDEETIRSADWIIDLGPGAGERGGYISAQGTLADILKSPKSLTAKFLSGQRRVMDKKFPRPADGRYLQVKGASQFNLKNIDVKIPLGSFVCVTGVSGSGKSTLVHEVIYKAMAQTLYGSKEVAGKHEKLEGAQNINKVIIVDQSPIGRTPRSNPATYTGVFTHIRELFCQLPEAKRRGFKAGRFSFNVKGGRCEKCQGDGILRIQMQFLPDIYVKCEECGGKRFNEDTLSVRFKGKNIADILEMSVEDNLKLFSEIPYIKNTLRTLVDVGLGYVRLGQSATTLSGGEAQRVKLSSELCRRATGRTLYILDEPTTGLHFADIEKLLIVLHRLVENGNTALVIEHNLDVIKTADWIIDLGPEGGDAGGYVVAQGPPEEIIKEPSSYTGKYLKAQLSD
ncbi:MAG: excinuclease ABC subunit UvrA [Elusimicrobia bacterium]|nr:excinuclease ABC subunit UvrA [Elusimicrobiota bacterium]